ncbi:MAG: sensor histidine kinase [Flavisolibacter sp.]
MKIFDTEEGLYSFTHLPSFVSFICEEHYRTYVEEQVDLSIAYRVPILKFFQHLDRDQLINMSMETSRDLLHYLMKNDAEGQIRDSLEKWLADSLEIIGKFDVTAEDITTLNFVRSKSLKSLIPAYTKDFDTAMALVNEIDAYVYGSITSATDTYIDILKSRINQREQQLLEAQNIARVGSFEWDILNKKHSNSPTVYEIFEIEDNSGFSNFMTNVHPLDKQRVEEALQQAFVSGEYECEYRYNANGREKFIWSKGRVEFADGKPAMLKGTIQDITERKKMEDALLQQTLELEQSNENLQQFASIASHDLKEPLRKIAMFVDMVMGAEGEKLSENSQSQLKRVMDSARRLQQMVDDILTFSTVVHDKEKQDQSLEALLNDVKESLEISIQEKNARITSDGLPQAQVNGSQFRRVFQNLLSNSLKFSKPGEPPVVRINHRNLSPKEAHRYMPAAAQGGLEICIEDNGIGFEAGYAEHIFGLFNRLHSKAKYEGSGIGLSITRKIIENHGGRIMAEARDNGACFRIMLPQTAGKN